VKTFIQRFTSPITNLFAGVFAKPFTPTTQEPAPALCDNCDDVEGLCGCDYYEDLATEAASELRADRGI